MFKLKAGKGGDISSSNMFKFIYIFWRYVELQVNTVSIFIVADDIYGMKRLSTVMLKVSPVFFYEITSLTIINTSCD